MTNASRITSVLVGLNSATNTFGTEPGAYVPILPAGEVPSLYPRERDAIDRGEVQTADGRELPHLLGPKNLDPIMLPTEVKGANSNTGGAVADWEAKLELGKLLVSMFGAVATATSSAAPVVKATGHSTTTLAEDSTTVLVALDVITFPTSLGPRTRQVLSVNGSGVATLDRSYTGTPTTGGTILRHAVYAMVPGRTRHKGIWVKYEDGTGSDSDRRDYKDCAPVSMKLTVPNSGKVTAEFTFKPNDWADAAEANPTFLAPTAGSPIVAGDASFFIGSVPKLFRSLSIDYQTGFEPRETPAGPNGIQGGECVGRKSWVMELEMFLGDDDGTVGDVMDDTSGVDLGDLQGDGSTIGTVATTQDFALSLGAVAGALMYVRVPEGAVISRVVSGGAYKVIKTTIRGTGSTPAYISFG